MLRGILIMLLSFASVPASCLARDCVDWENYLHYLGWGDTDGYALAMAPALHDGGDWIALADGPGGLGLLSIADSIDWGEDSQIDLPGFAMDVCFHERILYVAAYEAGLQIVQVLTPYASDHNITILDHPLAGEATRICAADDVVYVAAGTAGLHRVDVHDWEQPVDLPTIPIAGQAVDVCVANGMAYVAAGEAGVFEIDLDDPGQVRALDTPGMASAVAVDGALLLVADFLAGVHAVDIPSFTILDTFPGDGTSPMLDVRLADGFGYVAAGELGLLIFDVTTPSAMALVGGWDTPGEAQGIALRDTWALISASDAGVFAADVTNPGWLPIANATPLPGPAGDIVAGGGHLYTAVADYGLAVYAQADLAQVGAVGLDDDADALALHGDLLAYGGEEKLRLLDVSDPSQPALRDSLTLWAFPQDMVFDGDYLFVTARFGDGLLKVNVADPGAIFVEDSTTPCPGIWAMGAAIDVEGDYVYVCDDGTALAILDKTDLSQFSCNSVQGGAVAMEVVGGVAHLADGEAGLTLLDVSDPYLADHLWDHEVPGEARDIAVADGAQWVYLAYGWGDFDQVMLMDASGIDDPIPYGGADAGDDVRALALDGDFLYFVTGDAELVKYPAQCLPTAVEGLLPPAMRLASHPNPFNPSTTLRFELARAGRASLRIYDLAGRRLRTLVDGVFAAGPQAVSWDGRDAAGRPLAAGVYFARLETGRGQVSRKLVLLH